MTATTMVSQTEKTIDPVELTLTDWVAIAEAAQNKPLWGWNKWIEFGDNIEIARAWDLNQWGAAAELLGVSLGWALKRKEEL